MVIGKSHFRNRKISTLTLIYLVLGSGREIIEVGWGSGLGWLVGQVISNQYKDNIGKLEKLELWLEDLERNDDKKRYYSLVEKSVCIEIDNDS